MISGMKRVAILSLLAAGAAACSTPHQAERTPVPGDINASFLSEEANVESFAKRWELESREVYAARNEVLAAVDIQEGDAVADLGCGTGLYLEPFANAVGDAGKLYAVDISPKFVYHVRERAREAGLDQVEMVLSNERSAELPTGSVDKLFLCDVYHHFEYHEDMLRSIRRAIRPGGQFIVIDFERTPGVTREWLLGHVRAGKDVVRGEIEAAGFELLEEVEIGGFEENYFLRFLRP